MNNTTLAYYNRFRDVVSFGIVGLLTNVSFFLLFLIITGFGLSSEIAATVCYAGALLAGYMMNRSWSFRDRSPVRKTIWKYTALYAIGYLLVITMHSYLPALGLSAATIQIMAILLVMAFNFFAMKYLIFTGRDYD